VKAAEKQQSAPAQHTCICSRCSAQREWEHQHPQQLQRHVCDDPSTVLLMLCYKSRAGYSPQLLLTQALLGPQAVLPAGQKQQHSMKSRKWDFGVHLMLRLI
jgi:hypothetical protein